MGNVQIINPSFMGGSEWIRADFHLHTNSDKEFKYSGDPKQFHQEFIEGLNKNKIRVGVISNHNKFKLDEFKELRKKARKKDIHLLPGIELSINDGSNGIHTIIVFHDDWIKDGKDYINLFLQNEFKEKSPSEYENSNCRTDSNLLTTISNLESFRKDFFCVYAHVEDPNGLWNELDGGRIGELQYFII